MTQSLPEATSVFSYWSLDYMVAGERVNPKELNFYGKFRRKFYGNTPVFFVASEFKEQVVWYMKKCFLNAHAKQPLSVRKLVVS